MDLPKFAEKLFQYMSRAGITTNAALAEAVGVNRSRVGEWLKGTPPAYENLITLVKVLRLDIAECREFFELAGYKYPELMDTKPLSTATEWAQSEPNNAQAGEAFKEVLGVLREMLAVIRYIANLLSNKLNRKSIVTASAAGVLLFVITLWVLELRQQPEVKATAQETEINVLEASPTATKTANLALSPITTVTHTATLNLSPTPNATVAPSKDEKGDTITQGNGGIIVTGGNTGDITINNNPTAPSTPIPTETTSPFASTGPLIPADEPNPTICPDFPEDYKKLYLGQTGIAVDPLIQTLEVINIVGEPILWFAWTQDSVSVDYQYRNANGVLVAELDGATGKYYLYKENEPRITRTQDPIDGHELIIFSEERDPDNAFKKLELLNIRLLNEKAIRVSGMFETPHGVVRITDNTIIDMSGTTSVETCILVHGIPPSTKHLTIMEIYEDGVRHMIPNYSVQILADPRAHIKNFNTTIPDILDSATDYIDDNEFDAAYKEIQYAESLGYNQSKTKSVLAYYYVKLGELNEALVAADEAIQLDNSNELAYYSLDDSQRAELYFLKGYIYNQLGDNNTALKYFSIGIELDSTNASAYNNRGFIYYSQGKYDLAVIDYTQAIKLDPTNAFAYAIRGTIYYNQGKHELAVADYTQAIKLDSTNAAAYRNRGFIYFSQGKYESAATDYTQAIKLDPTDTFAYATRGAIYYKQGKHELAVADYTQAIKLDPTDAFAYATRGAIYYKQGKHELAVADYTQAIKLDPNIPSVHYHLADIYQNRGDYELATTEYREALAIDSQLPITSTNKLSESLRQLAEDKIKEFEAQKK